MNSEEDPEFGTKMLIEEYEYQANILVGSSEGGQQLASNRLFRLRKDMHAKIHDMLEEMDREPRCEFCFEEADE